MVVIARGVNESVMIGDKVQVTVLEIQGDVARLGIINEDENPRYREVTVTIRHEPETFPHRQTTFGPLNGDMVRRP